MEESADEDTVNFEEEKSVGDEASVDSSVKSQDVEENENIIDQASVTETS